MAQEKKVIIQAIPVLFAFVALAKRVEAMLETVKDGISEEEWAAAIAERDAALDEVIGKAG